MLKDRSARRRTVTFAILVGVCLLLTAVSTSGPVTEVRRGVNYALAPVMEGLSGATRSLTQIVAAVAELDQLRRERQELEAEVRKLREQVEQLEVVRIENERQALLLRTRATLARETVTAQVVERISTDNERSVTLDQGAAAGIETGDAVLSEGGALAGVVVEVGSEHSFVRLLNDTRSLVIGLDASSRATGEVVGRLSAPLAMLNIPVTQRVQTDDRVETAGLTLGRDFRSFFPRGLLIGKVVDVQSDPAAIVKTAFLEPSADLDRLETVLVITDYRPPRFPEPGESPELEP